MLNSLRRFGLVAAGAIAYFVLLTSLDRDPGVSAQDSLAAIEQLRASVESRVPSRVADVVDSSDTRPSAFGVSTALTRSAAMRQREACPTVEGNPISSMVAVEDNPRARAFEGFSMRDRHGRRTRPWRALRRADRAGQGVVIHRPLLVFLETPTEREDFTQPWFGPVRFDRPGFPTTKQKLVEQVFGKNFDYRDPASMAGFYYRESGGQLIIKGDQASVHTVKVPYMTFDPKPMATWIVEELDPVVDFTKRADALGWADPVIVMTPYSLFLDVFEPSLMTFQGGVYLGLGPNVEDIGPAITDDALPDGTHVGLASMAIAMVGVDFGGNLNPQSPLYELTDDQIRADRVQLYAHEYGHAIGLSHMMTLDYREERDEFAATLPFERIVPYPLNRTSGTGFVSTIMNYATGSGPLNFLPNDGRQDAGMDAVNRMKLGWGHVTEVTLARDGSRRTSELSPGERRRVDLVEHLGRGPHDPRPQILKIHLPPREVALFPHLDASGNRTSYWRPGGNGKRMAWSGRTHGGSRMLETQLRIPVDLQSPVLSFWTKYGGPSSYPHVPGFDLGWVQISTDRGRTWTSLAGQTSNTFVAPDRASVEWFGDDLGAPAFTGNSHAFAADGWVFEQVPLPVGPGSSVRIRFNFGGSVLLFNREVHADFGWFIDDVYLGTASDRDRHLISDFEHGDDRRWSGLLESFDQGLGWVAVEETGTFPQAYVFELRGNNPHDERAFKELYPKVINGRLDVGTYRYEEGIIGYYTDEYSMFSTYPYFHSGSATLTRVPAERLRRAAILYPFSPQLRRDRIRSFGALLELAFTPGSGVTLDDVAFITTLPSETTAAALFKGDALFATGTFSSPSSVTILDAAPTYRPFDVVPSTPQTPFPNRPSRLWPYVLGAPGGWPKSAGHGFLGLNDPTTTTVLGQPFLGRDAAFHPQRQAIYDDRKDYRGAFVEEFVNWHLQPTRAAFSSTRRAERLTLVPTHAVPVGQGQSIQMYELQYCAQNAAGACVPPAHAVQRPYIEQTMYERLVLMVHAVAQWQCPSPPAEVSAATKPVWDASSACLGAITELAHTFTLDLLQTARNLGNNPNYASLNAFGTQGTLSPELWALSYVDFWSRPKAPPAVPSFGLTVEVEHITRGDTPVATLSIRRAGKSWGRGTH
jgi:hypothetical protein